MNLLLKTPTRLITDVLAFILKDQSFCNKLKYRHLKFWKTPNAETIRNIALTQDNTIDEWKQYKHWQRLLSNKINSMQFAKMHGCSTPTIYWIGRDVREIDFERLPQQFVIKPSIGHSCQLVFLMNNGLNLLDQYYYTREELILIMEKALGLNSKLKFIVQEFLKSDDGVYRIPLDYKVHTFNGEIARIEVINRVSANTGSVSVFDKDWKRVENLGWRFQNNEDIQPPKCHKDIINQATVLSRAYEIYVRIDFYATDKGAVFGEFSPTPGRGVGFSKQADRLLASYWNLYCRGKI